jgi:iron complex transport system ATP-binding protein
MPITIEGIKFGYSESREVLKDMSFTCRDNRITGIIGPNGCGKTTVLKVIAGFLQPSAGTIRYNDTVIGEVPPIELAKMRAVVEQKIYTPFSFPVYDYVMLGRSPYQKNFQPDSDDDHKIVTDSLRDANVLQFQDRKINELSGGELQRVMIARALAQEPEFLMLDEPTSHLDIRHQLELMKLLSKLTKEKSVVCIIHEINQASTYCDDIIVTKDGYVLKEGDANEVLSAKTLEDVFGVLAMQYPGPDGKSKQFAFSLPPEKKIEARRRVHVISGEGMGRQIIMSLHSAGMEVTAGILNQGDQDFESAKSIGIETISAPPFTTYSDKEIVELKKACDLADTIILVAVNVGMGNLPNLEIAAEYLDKKEVIFVNPNRNMKKKDLTDGRATELYNLIQSKAKCVWNTDEVLEELL